MFATCCIPSEATRRFFLKKKKDISVIQKYSTAVMHAWGSLPLLPVFGTIFQNYTKILQFLSFRESLDLRLELIYIMYDKLTLGQLISWT